MTSTISDAELEAMALGAAPDPVLGDDAVPLEPPGHDPLLPSWYMPAPAPATTPRPGWRRRVAVLVIVSFLLINAAGLCSTYGRVTFG